MLLRGHLVPILTVAAEPLSLSRSERAEFAKLLIQSLEDPRTNNEIKADLAKRLAELRSDENPGLTVEEVFETNSYRSLGTNQRQKDFFWL